MQIRLIDNGTPLYRQIVDQIRGRIASGVLAGGSELPPIRKLAEQSAVNPNTVARAYRQLEAEGWIEKRRTRGTFVRSRLPKSGSKQHLHELDVAIDNTLDLAATSAMDLDALCRRVRQRASQRPTTPDSEPKAKHSTR